MANREAILAALRGAFCNTHEQWPDACADCDLARADAVLAAIQPPHPATRATARLRCDACKWEDQVAFDDIPSWHGKPCPACGKGTPIGDADMDAWRGIVQLEQAGLARPAVFGEPTADGYVRLHVDTARLRSAPPTLPGCQHPAACATTPDNPPHDGSTWTCAWCAEVAAWNEIGAMIAACDPSERARRRTDAGLTKARLIGILIALADHRAECRPALAAAQVRLAAMQQAAGEFLAEVGNSAGMADSFEALSAALTFPGDTAALEAALRKARADALRTAADTLAATCVTLGATVDLRQACQLLRRMADDVKAGT